MRRRRAAAAAVALLPVALAACAEESPQPAGAEATRCESASSAADPQRFTAAPTAKPDPAKAYSISLSTSCGTITAKLLAAEAPATVASFEFLAGKKFFDGTVCHRATQTRTLTVLQCGDPTGDGTGGPGYTLPEENLPDGGATGRAAYPRGTLAMARTSEPHSGGSQFFLVIKDSTLPPDYTIFGTVTEGLDVLDAILALGIDDADGDTASGLDGSPKQPVVLKTVRVTAT